MKKHCPEKCFCFELMELVSSLSHARGFAFGSILRLSGPERSRVRSCHLVEVTTWTPCRDLQTKLRVWRQGVGLDDNCASMVRCVFFFFWMVVGIVFQFFFSINLKLALHNQNYMQGCVLIKLDTWLHIIEGRTTRYY